MSFRIRSKKNKGITNKNKTNNIDQKLNAVDKAIVIDVKPRSHEDDESAERDKNKKAHFPANIIKFSSTLRRVLNNGVKYETQTEAFDDAMKYLLIVAQIFGLFPILLQGKNIPKTRWAIFSWRYVYAFFMIISQLLASILCLYNLVTSTVTIRKFGFFSFYLTAFVSSVSFMRVTTKWNSLMRQLAFTGLNEYVDPYIKNKCNFAIILLLSLGAVDHALSLSVKWTGALDCLSDDDGTDVLKTFIRRNYYWLFDYGVPYSNVFAIYLAVKNVLITMVWTYLHLFVICISLYLSSILMQINKVILSREGQYLPPSYWRKLREDYNRASRLVRCFDDVVNSIVLISFSSNMYFTCLQLYNILSYGIKIKPCYGSMYTENIYTSGMHGYLTITYTIYSLLFVMLRSLAVALIAAKVHSASLEAAPALYSVPSPTFCNEVQRFIEQIHGNTVALTGLNFFYVTKELILTVVGTIVTYELVMLQFGKP